MAQETAQLRPTSCAAPIAAALVWSWGCWRRWFLLWRSSPCPAALVAFPVAEYNEEATFQAQWIDGLIRETLEAVQPRSTEDALNFAATHEAAPTRLFYYIRETATALAR